MGEPCYIQKSMNSNIFKLKDVEREPRGKSDTLYTCTTVFKDGGGRDS